MELLGKIFQNKIVESVFLVSQNNIIGKVFFFEFPKIELLRKILWGFAGAQPLVTPETMPCVVGRRNLFEKWRNAADLR